MIVRTLRYLLIGLTALVALGIASGAGYAVALLPGGTQTQAVAASLRALRGEVPERFQLLSEVWTVLQQDFVEPEAVDGDRLGDGAIRGLLQALGDTHTVYIDAETYRLEQTSTQGRYEGIGAFVGVREGFPYISSIIRDTPAEAMGLRAGDLIVAVDGESTEGWNAQQTALRVRGPQGSTVVLTIIREGEAKPLEVAIVRGRINTPSVRWEMLEEEIGYLEIIPITSRSDDEVRVALQDLRSQGARKLVLDLRGNPGGPLEESVIVASQFVGSGIVLTEINRDGSERTFPVRRGGLATDMPIAVLVNEGSASGAEVIAGAIQDAGRGPLVGETTFGKGTVNLARLLSDGSALYVSIGRWKTPKGRLIEGIGLTPDIAVALTAEDRELARDPQLERAVAYLREASTSSAWPSTPQGEAQETKGAADGLWLLDLGNPMVFL